MVGRGTQTVAGARGRGRPPHACRALLPARRSLPVALVLLAALVSLQTHAHLPEYFGRKFVLVREAPEPAERPPACGGDRDALRRQVAELEERLEARRREEGAYSIVLADPTGEVGELYAQLCNHPAALEANRRAVQLLRINEGLLTRTQIPYLKAMADSSRAIGDYESAQLTMRYVFRIQGMGRGALTRAALEDSLAYFRRARENFIDPRARGDLDLFFQAYEDNLAMYEAQVARAADGQGEPYAVLRAISLSHLYNLYLVLGTDLSVYGGGAGDAGGARWNFMQRMQQLTYGKGLDVLEWLLAQPEARAGAERAGLLLHRGNWEQWNDKWQTACRSLEAAWHAAEAGSALRERLARPAELPEDPALWTYLQGADIPVLAEIDASFRVSDRGNVSRVTGEAIGDGSSGLAGRVLRWLRDSHMRPAVRDGVCVDGTLEGRRYRLLD